MKDFVQLFFELDGTTSSNQKIRYLVQYFSEAGPENAIWAVALLSGNRPKRFFTNKVLRVWLSEITQYPDWLIEDTYAIVGDLAETLSLMMEPWAVAQKSLGSLHELLSLNFPKWRTMDESSLKRQVIDIWRTTDANHRFVFNKLITGGFRVGVSKATVAKALAQVAGISVSEMTHRMTGTLATSAEAYQQLIADDGSASRSIAQPYPFYLSYALEENVETLGNFFDWSIEWKWDGIRCQVIKRESNVFVWSRGEELINESFPDLVEACSKALPDGTVLDGELLVVDQNGKPKPFSQLQKRLGRKKPSKKMQTEFPAGLFAYDLLEMDGLDQRENELSLRQERLKSLLSQADATQILLSPEVGASTWEDAAAWRKKSREMKAEGLMLKLKSSTYKVGRKKGEWWKWKVDPLTIDAVLLYAQAGHGRRANLYTDYTLAIWKEDALVPIAKAYSGLSDKEMPQLDRWIKANTRERFGPVRSVLASQVLEIAFEGISRSTRHKSGFALRFPRISRWRQDKNADEADTIDTVTALWRSYESIS